MMREKFKTCEKKRNKKTLPVTQEKIMKISSSDRFNNKREIKKKGK